MKYLILGAAVLGLLAVPVAAQYDELWECEVLNPHESRMLGIADTDDDSALEMVYLDLDMRTDQYPLLTVLDLASGEQEWTSDEFYHIYTESKAALRLEDVDSDGAAEIIIMAEYDPGYPEWFMFDYAAGPGGLEPGYVMKPVPTLGQNRPNPVRRATRIEYSLPEETAVRLRIYDVSGKLVRILESGEQAAGTHLARWDARDDQGRLVGEGTYYYVLEAGKTRSVRKAVVVK